ncbi:MAG: RluA family pseudouridine synthase, partial [Brumimicrobium sp.]|nr:RluA family pseudouridine synthase [Brumimicrobium sp.]
LIKAEESVQPKIWRLPIPVVYQDNYLAVINKPVGPPVSGNRFRTVQNALPYNLVQGEEPDALMAPLPVHRLDAVTGGLLIIAKNYSSRIKLGEMFENRQIEKRYLAVVEGKLEGSGLLNSQVEGKNAQTIFRSLNTVRIDKRFYSLLELCPETGRKHQIRRHLSRLGFPIAGDSLYNAENDYPVRKGLLLYATGLRFNHPITNELLEINIHPPSKFDPFL